MKKIIITSMLFIVSFSLIAQDVFIDKSSQKEYLFLGSISENEIKLLDTKNNTIVWLDNTQLQQIDRLSPREFSEKIFGNELAFYASGDEPFWKATITKNKLLFLAPISSDEIGESFPIQMNINKYNIDYAFLLMFQSKDHRSYGMIRELTVDSPCEISLSDETSVFEVFINYQGETFKGCAVVDK